MTVHIGVKYSLARLIGVIFFVAGGLAVGQNTHATADKWEAPPEAAAVPNPEASNPDASRVGRKSYLHICANCHGDDGSGQNNGAANLRLASVQSQSDGALFWKITNGNTDHGMPSFANLSETSRWDIVTFLRTLKDSSGDNSGGSGDPKKETPPNSDKQQQ
jgi:mono/diheme cytochrome c family protein